jgi:hypothetical protein
MDYSGVKSHGFVRMVGPDTRMDQYGNMNQPCNPPPLKCSHCTFPDLDFVAEPYLLAKGMASQAETAPAQFGNFLVRESARRLLELALPGAFTFHVTADFKSKEPTPWSLAAPRRAVATATPDPAVPRCSKCGEPRDALSWGQHVPVRKLDVNGLDVFKAMNWSSFETVEEKFEKANAYQKEKNLPPLPWSYPGVAAPTHAERWTRRHIDRDLFFSLRLEQLLKQAKVKGQLVRSSAFNELKPTAEDAAWVEEKLRLLAGGNPERASGAPERSSVAAGSKKKGGTLKKGVLKKPDAAKTGDAAARRWFGGYLKKNAAGKKPARADFVAVEKKHKLALPQDYKDFISAVGPKSFRDVMQQEGFEVRVLPPGKLDFKTYRRGNTNGVLFDEESLRVDGVTFADTVHGDCFVFDVSDAGAGDYPVFWYDHENSAMEPFAPGFAQCIRRFAERT